MVFRYSNSEENRKCGRAGLTKEEHELFIKRIQRNGYFIHQDSDRNVYIGSIKNTTNVLLNNPTII